MINIAQQIVPNLDRPNKEDINKLTLRFKGKSRLDSLLPSSLTISFQGSS